MPDPAAPRPPAETYPDVDRLLYDDPNPTHTPIPRGVADYFWSEALERRQLEAKLLALFRAWGYSDVIPPSIEYADTFAARADADLLKTLYRFPDRDGSTVALRLDMTIPVARLVGTRLHDWPMPQRYCYAGSVFRYDEPQAGRQREFWQAGVECIGSHSPQADAEVIALAGRALTLAGLANFRLVLGQMLFFNGLLADLQLAPGRQEALKQAIDRNSDAEIHEFLRDTPLRTHQRRAVEELPLLSGRDHSAILDQAGRISLNRSMHAALNNLHAICDLLAAHGLADHVYLDLTEIQNLGYYTGITFEALTPGLGFPVASGGRYDNLIGTYGPDLPAVGLAVGLDRLLLARNLQAGHQYQPKPVPTDCLVTGAAGQQALALVAMLRARGYTIACELDGLPLAQLAVQARRLGIRRLLAWTGDGFTHYRLDAGHPSNGHMESNGRLDHAAPVPSATFIAADDHAALLRIFVQEETREPNA